MPAAFAMNRDRGCGRRLLLRHQPGPERLEEGGIRLFRLCLFLAPHQRPEILELTLPGVVRSKPIVIRH